MPIKPENKYRYPADWIQIRARILERANGCCEGSPDFPECREKNYWHHSITGSRVVLTVAHLDHVPENCDEKNLKGWCQRCHLNYDRKHRAKLRITKENHLMTNAGAIAIELRAAIYTGKGHHVLSYLVDKLIEELVVNVGTITVPPKLERIHRAKARKEKMK